MDKTILWTSGPFRPFVAVMAFFLGPDKLRSSHVARAPPVPRDPGSVECLGLLVSATVCRLEAVGPEGADAPLIIGGGYLHKSPLRPQIARNRPKPQIFLKTRRCPENPQDSHWIHAKRHAEPHWLPLSSPELSRNFSKPNFARIPPNPLKFPGNEGRRGIHTVRLSVVKFKRGQWEERAKDLVETESSCRPRKEKSWIWLKRD